MTNTIIFRRSGRGDRGVITNTASILGLVGGPVGASPYAASKHAILGMTKTVYIHFDFEWITLTFTRRLSLTAKTAFGSIVFVQGKSNLLPDTYSEFQV